VVRKGWAFYGIWFGLMGVRLWSFWESIHDVCGVCDNVGRFAIFASGLFVAVGSDSAPL